VGELVEKIPSSKLATGYVQGSEIEDPCVKKLETLRIQHMGRRISPLNDFRAWVELRQVIKDVKPLIVHTHTFKAGIIGRLVGGGHKRVHTFHGHLFDDQSFSLIEKKMITLVERYLARRTNLLISVGKKVGVELRAEGIGTDKNWLSIPPGVQPLPIFNQTEARNSIGVTSGEFLIGWMARMAEVKNPLMLLEVANELKELNFVMAGGGDLLDEIRSKAPGNVTVIGWADPAMFWSAVDCGISTSSNEGMPIALIEAQLAGVPVIATDVGSTAEVISDQITGYITLNNANELAKAIRKLFSSTPLRLRMKEESKVRARNEFNVNKMIELHKRAYDRISR
jgi:glycosyltransferase involved in cell wall biosynthesis